MSPFTNQIVLINISYIIKIIMNIKKTIILFIFLFLSISFNLSSTFACSCIIPESPEKELEKSDSVFIWRVISIEKEKSLNQLLWNINKNIVNFEVKANIKWISKDSIIAETAESSASCGYNFEEGKEYIVYWNIENWELNISLCSRTSLVSNASEDLEAFKDILNTNQENAEKENDSVLVSTEKWTNNSEDSNSKMSNTAYVLIFILISLIIWAFVANSRNKKD